MTTVDADPYPWPYDGCLDGGGHQFLVFAKVQGMAFAGAAASRDAMHAVVDEPVDLRLDCGEVDFAVRLEGGGNRGDNTLELVDHWRFIRTARFCGSSVQGR